MAGAATSWRSSAKLFHSPQSGHRPSHFELSKPQAWQARRVPPRPAVLAHREERVLDGPSLPLGTCPQRPLIDRREDRAETMKAPRDGPGRSAIVGLQYGAGDRAKSLRCSEEESMARIHEDEHLARAGVAPGDELALPGHASVGRGEHCSVSANGPAVLRIVACESFWIFVSACRICLDTWGSTPAA